MDDPLAKKVYRSLVTLPRIFIGIQFLVIVILVAMLVS
jgi:hypothetical protein